MPKKELSNQEKKEILNKITHKANQLYEAEVNVTESEDAEALLKEIK